MSFGFSIGDFLGVIKDIHHIRRVFVGAPAQFKFLHDEVRRLSIVILDVETYIPNEEQKGKLERIAESCKSVVADIWKVIDQYQEIGEHASIKRVWKRLKLDPEDVRELRDRVCSVIQSLTAINVRITQDQVQELVKYKNDKQYQIYLDWLSLASYAADQYNAVRLYQPGTGRWFIESPGFQTWINNSGQTLFCPGIPGAGKTIMASVVIDELEYRYGNDTNVGIAFLFCSFQYHDDSSQSPESLLASLIRQLVQRLPQIPLAVELLYAKHRSKGSRPSFTELSKALNDIVQVFLTQTFIVVDALDECNSVTISRILSQIFDLQATNNLNLLATSRSVPEIEARFQGRPFQEVRATKEDVMKYIDARLNNCKPCALTRRPCLRGKARLAITESVKGMFLLARLYLDSLISMARPKEIRDELTRLTKRSDKFDGVNATVDDAYKTVMGRISKQVISQENLAKDALSWVICAKRPLTTLELRTALTVELGQSCLDEENLLDLEDIISSCAGLITTGSDGANEVVQLAHYTMQEYFIRHQTELFPEAHKNITASCLTYLSYDVFQQGMCSNDIEFESRLSQYPLYSYAARNWGIHARVHLTTDDLTLFFLRETSKLDACVQAIFSLKTLSSLGSYCRRVPLNFTATHLAAYFGMENVLRLMIDKCDQSHVRDSMNRNPLTWAALSGHVSVVKMLLDHGVDACQQDEDGRTPISVATSAGCTNVVELLLDYKIDPNSRDIENQTPLIEASYREHYEIVELLLDRGAHPDPKDDYGKTPFIWACYYGAVEIVRALLNHSVATITARGGFIRPPIDFDHKDKQGNTALSYALERGHLDVVDLLREKGVLLEQESHFCELPLRNPDARGNDATGAVPYLEPVTSWPLIDAQGTSTCNKRRTPRREFKCPLCLEGQEMVFSLTSSLLRHVSAKHCPDEKFTCPEPSCGRYFHRRDRVHMHYMLIHGKEISGDDKREMRQTLSHPTSCLVCQNPTGSWRTFRACILEHSKALSSSEFLDVE